MQKFAKLQLHRVLLTRFSQFHTVSAVFRRTCTNKDRKAVSYRVNRQIGRLPFEFRGKKPRAEPYRVSQDQRNC